MGATVSGVAVGDVDGDGDLDFASANAGGSTASVGLNNGSGVFTSVATYGVGQRPSAVQLADVDNDGDLDLLTSNLGSNSVSICLNNGNGGFGPNTQVSVGGPPTDLAMADIDGDGDQDFMATNSIGIVNIRVNINGGFASAPGLALPVGSAPTGLSTGDVDADGDFDLVVAQGPGGQVITFLNNGAGTFTPQTGALVLSSLGGAASSSGVTLGDVDGDGDLDLVTANGPTGRVVLGRNEVAPVLNGFSPTSGAPGAAITLTGANLQGTRRIAFAGPLGNVVTSGFVVNAAGSQITGVVVPGGAVSGPISVTTAGGTATTATSFAVNAAQLWVLQNGTAYPPTGTGYAFGSQVVAAASGPVVFTLSNPGSLPLTLAGITTTGSFALSGPVPATVPAGGTATLGVVFQPPTIGGQTGALVLASNAAGYPSYTVPLAGTGVLPLPTVASVAPASARAGSLVTIFGTNLAGATAVVFAGTANRTVTSGFTVNGAGTEITGVEVPAGAATGPVTVTTLGGTSAGVAFTVLPPLPPTISGCNPGGAPEGATVTLTGTNLTGTTQVVFYGLSTTFQVVNSTTITAVVPRFARTGTVTAITPGGYSNNFPFRVVPRIMQLTPIAGQVGTSVMVFGTTMSEVTSAQINGVAAPVSSAYASDVRVTVPTGATSGLLSVSSPSGASNALPFTVTLPMTLTRVSPTSSPAGTALTLTGTNLRGASAIVFTGVGVNTVTGGFVVNAAGTQITGVVVPAGAQTGPIFVQSANGQSSYYTSIFTVTGTAVANAPAWQMVNTMYNTPLTGTQLGGGGYVFGSAADASGNVFVVGQFFGTVAFGRTILRCLGSTSSSRAAFLAKWSPVTREYVWAQMYEGGGGLMNSVAVNGTSVYVTGNFVVDNARVLVAKFADQGGATSLVWTQAPSVTVATGAAVAVQGTSVYVAGSFAYFYTPPTNIGFGATTLTSAGNLEGFVAKLADTGASGTWTWAKRLGGNQNDEATALAVNGSTVYVSGNFKSATADFDAIRLPATLSLAGDVTTDGFVAKLTDAGNTASFNWAQGIGGTANGDGVNALAVQGSSLYVAGRYEQEARFGTQLLGSADAYGGVNGFVAKLTDAGNAGSFTWAQPVYRTGFVGLQGLAATGNNVYVVGYSNGNTRVGSTTTMSGAQFLTNCFVAKLVDGGSTSSFSWVQVAGGPSGNAMAQAVCTQGIAVYVSGYVDRVVPFGSTSTPGGTNDYYGFLASLTDSGTPTPTQENSPVAALLEVFPNPAHEKATLVLPATAVAGPVTLALLDALGRIVRTETVLLPAAGLRHEYSLAGLPAGVYSLRATSASLVAVRRLAVE